LKFLILFLDEFFKWFQVSFQRLSQLVAESWSEESILQLYYSPLCPNSKAVLHFCLLQNIPIDPIEIDLLIAEQRSPEYEKLNPNKQVPCIVDGKFVLTESHTILRYLASKYYVSDMWYPTKKGLDIE
jgi:glutathione S-transferase